MKYLCVFIFFSLCSTLVVSQEKSVQFPDDFFGIYSGDLQISSEKGNQIIPMEFHLMATDSVKKYTYKLIYGVGEAKQVRAYSLIEKDKDNGLYVVDENNGIILDNKVLDNRMYTLSEVNNTLLTTFITFESAHMVFEIIATPKSNKRVTYADAEEKIEVI